MENEDYMKRLIKIGWYSVSLLTIVIHASSCKKADEPDEVHNENYRIAVNFKDFEQTINPLTPSGRIASGIHKLASTTSPGISAAETTLYFWSFNQQTLMPDVAVGSGSAIIFNQGERTTDYGPGWSYEDYSAGYAISAAGVTDMVFRLPLNGIAALSTLGFDIGSSNTGPKDFSLAYSQDGVNYIPLSANNQFSNTGTAHARHSFTYALADIVFDFSKDLFIKISALEGVRDGAGAYRESTGVIRLDNFRLRGKVGALTGNARKNLHYHVFDEATKALVYAGVYDYAVAALGDFTLSLPAGNYIASFVANESMAALPIPADADALAYHIANTFANHDARIFGVLDTFEVRENRVLDLTLERYYSEVNFEFTDQVDLAGVKTILIKALHQPTYYAPFNPSFSNRPHDQSVISKQPDFTLHKTIRFNQFLGRVFSPVPLSYAVEVYGADNLLIRTFTVSAEMVNNMQLTFRGALLAPTGTSANFVIRFNENWDGTKTVDF